MARRERAAVIDAGATWVTCLYGEKTETGQLKVTGWGRSPANGWKNGMIVHPEKAVQAVAESCNAATESAGYRMDTVYVTVTGEHVSFLRGKGTSKVARPRSGISKNDINRVISEAMAVTMPQDAMIIHVIPIQFIVDGQKGVMEPRGLVGTKLEAEVHLVIAGRTVVENIYRVIESAGLRVHQPLLRGMATALGATEPEERNGGVAVIHLGAMTEVVIYRAGALRYNVALTLGGEHITSDIAQILRLPYQVAEQLKLEFAVATTSLLSGEETIPVAWQNTTRQISRRVLIQVVEPRAEEILRHACDEIRKSNIENSLNFGVVLTGGTARMPGIKDLAEQVTDLPVRLGNAGNIQAPEEIIGDPSFLPAIGLLRYALRGTADIANTVVDTSIDSSLWQKLWRLVSRLSEAN